MGKSLKRLFGCILGIVFMASIYAYAEDKQNYPGEVGEVKGVVEILKNGETEYIPAVEEMPVQLKDRIKTAKNSSCNLELDDGSLIYIGENTEASVDALEIGKEKHNSKISLWLGKIIANIAKLKNTKMEVHSLTSVVAVRGTEFAVEAAADKTDVGVFEGEVAVKSGNDSIKEEVSVKPDEQTTVLKDQNPSRPYKLTEVMERYKERNKVLKGRLEILRERLKKESPERRTKMRQLAMGRFQKMKERRSEQMKQLKMKRQGLRRNNVPDNIQQQQPQQLPMKKTEPVDSQQVQTDKQTIQPTTVQPATIQPTTVQPATVQPTTVQPETVQPTRVLPETVQPITVQPGTVQPIKEQPTTVQPAKRYSQQ
ncbi:MAG: FecR domain-containing protein [Elusimicrobia bacterium]|nr:FecR domain-containing protein [Elusimicrobiota bacterium]